MKIQIDLPDSELWSRFKDEVTRQGKTLREVVPTVFEPALRWYLHDPPLIEAALKDVCEVAHSMVEVCEAQNPPAATVVADSPPPSAYQESVKRITAPPYPPVKRCDLCDMPTERTFNHKGRRVCYTCWRDGIINEGTKPLEPQVKP